jgi:ABC-type glycerol-3-phosphate transport system permease component
VRRNSSRNGLRTRPLLLLAFIFLALIDAPILWMILTSLHSENQLLSGSLRGLFAHLGLGGYSVLSSFWRYVVNSIIVCLLGSVVVVSIAVVCGYSLQRTRFHGRLVAISVLAFSLVMPYATLIIPLYVGYLRLGLLNSYLGLVIAYVAVNCPITTLLMMGYYRSFPRELEESAEVDGAGVAYLLARIVLPNSWPGIVVCFTYAFIGMWQDFLVAGVVMSEQNRYTLPLGMASLFGQYSTEWNSVMAVASVSIIPGLILFAAIQGRLTGGGFMGAVKG